MKRNLAINIALALVLCISQIAANIHAAGHLQAQEPHVHHTISSHGESPHLHTEIEEVRSADLNNDCAAYHTLAAMSGIGPVNPNPIEKRTKFSIFVTVHTLTLVALSVNTKPIRGPPIYS